VQLYETQSEEYERRRTPDFVTEAHAFGKRCAAGPVVDLGSGPGWYTAALGPSAIALDAARAMLRRTGEITPSAARVQADLAHLPFRSATLAGAWARNSYVHLRSTELPMALHDLHRSLAVGAQIELTFFGGEGEGRDLFPGDDLPGRWFSTWPQQRLSDVVVGAGFVIDELTSVERRHGHVGLTVRATRPTGLADLVAPGLRLLVCGLNPSLRSAEAGTPYVTPGNRFWPAALAAGLVSRDRDPRHALDAHGIGITDLVKRATPRADGLARGEYQDGLDRLDRLCAWLEPASVCMVGLAGWRAAVDRGARPGWQERRLGGRPVYVMPSTSGLNAAIPLPALAEHLRTALAGT